MSIINPTLSEDYKFEYLTDQLVALAKQRYQHRKLPSAQTQLAEL